MVDLEWSFDWNLNPFLSFFFDACVNKFNVVDGLDEIELGSKPFCVPLWINVDKQLQSLQFIVNESKFVVDDRP